MRKFSPYLILCFILLMTIVFCCLQALHYGHNWGGDFALYLHQAQSLWQGNMGELKATNQFIVAHSSDHHFSPTLYPWGFPLVLAPIYAVFGVNFFVLKCLEIFFFICALGVMFKMFTSKLSSLYGVLLIAIIGLNMLYIKSVDQVLSELPFMCFAYLGLYLIMRFLDDKTSYKVILGILVGLVLFLCFSIRTEGIGLFAALLMGQIVLFVKKRKGPLWLHLLPYLSGGILYVLSCQVLPTGFTSHLGYKTLVSWSQIQANITAYINWLNADFLRVALVPYFVYIVLIFVVLGMITRWRKDTVLLTFLLFLLGVFSIWPFHVVRYLYCVYPLLLYFFIQGVLFLEEKWFKTLKLKWVTLFFLGLCLTSNLTYTAKETYANWRDGRSWVKGPETPNSQEMFAYIKAHTPSQAIIGFFKPRVMHFYTDRRSLALFDNLNNLIDNADYYVENKNAGYYFQIPLSYRNNPIPDALKKVFSNSSFTVYKILK